MQNRINKICKNIIAITDEEIKEMEGICEQQINYMSPLKMATTRKQNELGRYNQKVLDKLIDLRKLIKAGENAGA